MLHAVIDIGSNTIRLSVYDCAPDGAFSLALARKVTAGLAGYVENGELSSEGMDAACAAISDFQTVLAHIKPDSVSAFATASLRNITNTEQALEQIQKETGFLVDVISGKEEARLDFLGVMQTLSVSDGLVVDIGGGSCELVSFSDKKLEQAQSIPLGSLNLFSNYVEDLFPEQNERRAMKRAVLQLLKRPEMDFGPRKVICGVGGTLRSTAKLCRMMGVTANENEFTVKESKKVLKLLQKDKKLALRQILRAAPERVHTLLPGMILFHAVAGFYESESVIISRFGVREGYLADRVLSK